jgi:hypothetical protein
MEFFPSFWGKFLLVQLGLLLLKGFLDTVLTLDTDSLTLDTDSLTLDTDFLTVDTVLFIVDTAYLTTETHF